jgi:hypothetical protein
LGKIRHASVGTVGEGLNRRGALLSRCWGDTNVETGSRTQLIQIPAGKRVLAGGTLAVYCSDKRT